MGNGISGFWADDCGRNAPDRAGRPRHLPPFQAGADYVRAHRSQLRVFSCRSGHRKPGRTGLERVKNNRIGKQPVKNKEDLKARLTSALDSLKQNSQRIISPSAEPSMRRVSQQPDITDDATVLCNCQRLTLQRPAIKCLAAATDDIQRGFVGNRG